MLGKRTRLQHGSWPFGLMCGGGLFGQPAKIDVEVVISKKHDKKHVLTIVAALGNVMVYVGDDNASGSSHEE